MPPSEAIFHRFSTTRAYRGSPKEGATGLFGQVHVEHRAEVPSVPHGEVPIAIVHQDVRLPGVGGQAFDLGNPLLELILLVVVPEALARALALRLPCLGIPAVEPNHGDVVGGGRGDRWYRGIEALRHVHA